MREVLMVCFGNNCRSPMAEAMLQKALVERVGAGHDIVVSSAGIGATDGLPPSQGSIRAMKERGIDIRAYRSTLLTRDMACRAALIYVMERYQAERVREMLDPEEQGKVRLMGDEEIPDPIGQGQVAYEMVARAIERQIPVVVEEIAASLGDPVA